MMGEGHLHAWAKGVSGWTCVHCGAAYEPTEPVARRSDPETSWTAAGSVSKRKLTRTRQNILDSLRRWGPMTDEAIWKSLVREGQDHLTSVSGARTRRKELVDIGLVEDSGRRVRGSTNRKMIVWRATA